MDFFFFLLYIISFISKFVVSISIMWKDICDMIQSNIVVSLVLIYGKLSYVKPCVNDIDP